MASGYEQHPDYGGKDPSPLEIIIIVVAIASIAGYLFFK
jgi:hypothetical protein